MKKAFFILYFFYFTSTGQTPEAVSIINNINSEFSNCYEGIYTMQIRFRPPLMADTGMIIGTMYFSKKQLDKDSIGQFILHIPIDSIYYIYDGITFDYVNFKFKLYEERLIGNKNLMYDALRGSIDYELIDWALLTSKFRKIKLEENYEAIYQYKNDLLFINQCDTMSSPKFKFHYWQIDPIKKYVKQETSIIKNPSRGTQFLEYNYSAVLPISFIFKPDYFFSRDSLKKIFDYKFKDLEHPELTIDSTLKAGEIAPSWKLIDINDKEMDFSKNENGLTLIDFFFKTCTPCLQAIPSIIKICESYKQKGLTTYGIDPIDKNDSMFREFIRIYKINYDILFDKGRKVASQYHVMGYPTVFLIDNKSKKIIYMHRGFSESMESDLIKIIEENIK